MGLIWALGAGCCCALLGISAAAGLKNRYRQLQAWMRALERLERAMGEAASMPEALRRGNTPCFHAMASLLEEKPLLSLEEAWLQCSGEEAVLLQPLFRLLDHENLSGRKQAVQQALRELEEKVSQAGEKTRRNQALYRSLGLLGGLALVLMLF